MSKNSKRLVGLAVAAALAAPVTVYATNGMNMEGYGPISTAMGGASMAYDNGTAAMANNPATLGMMQQGNQLDLAWGFLGPDVTATPNGYPKASSSANAFNMPAVGWARNTGKLTYGAGVYAQGGMGTEYSANSSLAMGSGDKVRSEVGVARIIFPLSYRVNNKLNVGGSIDWVRATMDLKMAVPSNAFAPTTSGGLVDFAGTSAAWQSALTNTTTGFPAAQYTWGRFDFSDNSPYSGMAKGDGFAAKLGFTYQVNQALTVGGVYQSETSLSDLKATGANMSAGGSQVGAPNTVVHGDIKVKNFQWPTTYGLGLSYAPNDKWMVAADVKQLQWSEVMKNFKMTFSNGTYGDLAVVMPQHWKDQTVIELGGAYKVNQAFTVRAGYNHADNPIPNDYVNPLFPAIVEDHYTAGFGYMFSKASEVNFSATYAPKVSVTGSGSMNQGMKITHSQTNWQLMYSHRF